MSDDLMEEQNFDREIPSLNSGRSRNNPLVGVALVIGALGMVGYLFYLMNQQGSKEVEIEPPKEYQTSTVPKLKLPEEVIIIPTTPKAPELPKSLEPIVADLAPINANLPYVESEEDRLKREELERQRLLAEQERIRKEKIAMRKMRGKIVSFSGNGSNDEIIGGGAESSLEKYNIPEGLSPTNRLIAEKNNLENELEELNRKKARVDNARRTSQSRSPYFPDNSGNTGGGLNKAPQRSNNQRPQPSRTNAIAQPKQENMVEEAPSINAQIVKDAGYKIVQGKVIGAILETAIQSDRAGSLRATSTEPVYSYNGERELLPLGSRFIGSYKGGVKQGQARISIIWDRVITPEGISINLASNGIGALGRAGAGGYIDSHFAERFGSSILLSIIGGVTASKEGDSDVKDSVKEGFNKSSSIALENSIGIKPTLHKNQGTTIRIFVAHDFNLKNVYQ